MWNAFMNGSGMHGGGGGAGGGYVPSQGWEFVPCSGMDRGRGKSRNPLRRISSPPTVFSHIYESQFGASPGGGEGGEGGGAGTQLDNLRGQMWPGAEAQQQQQQQQTQHTRLKKKVEDLKKRHVQDKEEWMREKESLLREVADIQGGENRRILLELKTVLEEVQVEVKREEEKRSELQLQYTRDRCAWELEKAELKCRIAQLEAREGAGSIGGGVQQATGPVAPQGAPRQHGETATLRREREEQRRLLADTHSTAMDLRCRLDHNERDWLREKAELLEMFDVERRVWECQLKDMQSKIEELYCDVRVKREVKGGGRRGDNDDVHALSIRSTSTGSSLLSDNEPLSSSSSGGSQSEPTRHPPLPGLGHNRDIGGREAHHSSCFQAGSLCGYDNGGRFTQSDHLKHGPVDELSPRGTWRLDSDGEEAADTIELDATFDGAPQENVSNTHGTNIHVPPEERPLWAELSYGSDKKKNTTALNAALKEIARVSEELCSYQDEIRKKSGDKRNRSGSACLPEGSEMLFGRDKTRLEVDDAPCDLSQIYDDLRALERETWITLSPKNTWSADRGPSKSWMADFADPECHRETKTSPGLLSEMDTAGPPIPPRSSSWGLSSPTFPDTELYIPESPMMTERKCHSPCGLADKKCSSPSIVRKFEAMLQENEGKVLIDGVVASCSVPANSECVNKGCCHNRWSCDTSKFTSSKLSTYGTVQKSFSEVNIQTAAKVSRSDSCPGVGSLKSPELQIPQIAKELPLNLLLSSLETPPAGPDLQGSRRNVMLEQKTAEFNRTLFQAEMGRGVEKQNRPAVTDDASPPREKSLPPLWTDVTTSVTGVYPEITLSLSAEVQLRRTRYGAEGQEVRTKQGIPSELSSVRPQMGLGETTAMSSQSPARRCEVTHDAQTASGPSRKAEHRAAAEAPISEPGQSVDVSIFEDENPCGAKPQSARAAVSLQQPSAENKQRQMTQPRHASALPSQSDSSRPGPRMMMMNDHPWKALTLAAYPRPEGSRSNYGAVERILKNYESAARAHQSQSRPDETDSSPTAENETELDTPDVDPLALPPTLRHAQTSNSSEKHTAQLSSHSAASVKELHLLVEENDVTSVSRSARKNFSRPARPANRRLPSRWAGRSPTTSSSPVAPPPFALHKHRSSFSYSHVFHMETVII